MSERLSSVEIEDVLSSIRRLVSEDLRPGAKAEAAGPAAAPVAEPAGGDKLILTPALRIGPDAEAPVAAAGEADTVTPAFTSVRQGRGASVVDRVTRAMPDGDWEPVAEPAAVPRSDWASEAEAAAEAAGDGWTEAPVAPVEQTADPEMAADAAEQPGAAEVAEDEVGGDEAEAWPASDAPEANWSDPGAQAPMESESPEDPGWSDVEPMAIDRPAGGAEVMAAGSADDFVYVSDARAEGGDAALSAAMEADIPSDLPDWARMEADADETTAPVTPASGAAQAAEEADPEWADAAEAEIRRELQDEATATVFARFEEDDHDDRHFDEEMLRDLVRDIIREELQGALGERITRNVRKLVRAEIARAMAVRDFE